MSYPTILSFLSDKNRVADRFVAGAATLLEAEKIGEIANMAFKGAKDDANRGLQDAFNKAMNSASRRLGYQIEPDDIKELEITGLYPFLHLVQGTIRRVEAIETDRPCKALALTILNEALPLAKAVASLKDKVVKRQPKPVEDSRVKYNAPGASQTAIGRVKTLLEQITENQRAELEEFFRVQMKRHIEKFFEQQYVANAVGKECTPHDVFSKKGQRYNTVDIEAVKIVETTTIRKYMPPMSGYVYVSKVDKAKIIDAAAKKNADEICHAFIYKNLGKLDSIMDAKPNLVGGEIIGSRIDVAGMHGTLRFTFTDGAAFTVALKVVWTTNGHGTNFSRTPLTFHDVVLASGNRMTKPSEERMNTVFVGKSA